MEYNRTKTKILEYMRHHFPNLEFEMDHKDEKIGIFKGEDLIGDIRNRGRKGDWNIFDSNDKRISKHLMLCESIQNNGNYWVERFNWKWLKEWNE